MPDPLDTLRRIRYLSGHHSTVPSSTMSEIYLHATKALPNDEPIYYPPDEPPAPREHPAIVWQRAQENT